jgi:hypothetical protein
MAKVPPSPDVFLGCKSFHPGGLRVKIPIHWSYGFTVSMLLIA